MWKRLKLKNKTGKGIEKTNTISDLRVIVKRRLPEGGNMEAAMIELDEFQLLASG